MNFLAILELGCLILGTVYMIDPLRTFINSRVNCIKRKKTTTGSSKDVIEFNNNQAESINYWTKEYVKGDKGINIILGFVRVVLFLIGGYLFITFPIYVFINKQFGLDFGGPEITLITITLEILLLAIMIIVFIFLDESKVLCIICSIIIISSVCLFFAGDILPLPKNDNFNGFLHNSEIAVFFVVGEWVLFKILVLVTKIANTYFTTAKTIDEKWHRVADVILLTITTYVFRIIRNPVRIELEIGISLCRIVSMTMMAYSLFRLLCAIVVEAIVNGLRYRHLTVLKFVLCIIFMQVAVFTSIMTEGVILSQVSPEKHDYFQFDIGKGSTINIKDDFYGTEEINTTIIEVSTSNESWRGLKISKDLILFLYYIIVTFTSVGYGDIFPVTVLSRLFAGIICLSGYATSAIVIAVLLSGIGGNSNSVNGKGSKANVLVKKKKSVKCRGFRGSGGKDVK